MTGLNFIRQMLIGLWKMRVANQNGGRSECDWLNCSMALHMSAVRTSYDVLMVQYINK